MSTTLVHSHNKYILLTTQDNSYTITNLNDQFPDLHDIYPQSIYSHDYHHFILDINKNLHVVSNNESKIQLYTYVYKTDFTNKQINGQITGSQIWYENGDRSEKIEDFWIYINQYDCHKCINSEVQVALWYDTQGTCLRRDINDLNYNVPNVVSKTNYGNGVLFDYCTYIRLRDHIDNDLFLPKHYFNNCSNIRKIEHENIIQFVNNGILYSGFNEDHGITEYDIKNIANMYDANKDNYSVGYHKIINLDDNNIKQYYYNFYSLCYVNNDDEIIVLNCDTNSEQYNKSTNLGVINGKYDLVCNDSCAILYFVNAVHVVAIDMIHYKRINIDYPLNISHFHMTSLNNFIWSFDTHKLLSHDYKQIILTFLLCNKTKQLFKIPKYITFEVFHYLCNSVSF